LVSEESEQTMVACRKNVPNIPVRYYSSVVRTRPKWFVASTSRRNCAINWHWRTSYYCLPWQNCKTVCLPVP